MSPERSSSPDDKSSKTLERPEFPLEFRIGGVDRDGRTIDFIHGLGRTFVVYTTSPGGVNVYVRDLPQEFQPALMEYARLMNLARTRLRGTYKNEFSSILGMALSSALFPSQSSDPLEAFAPVTLFLDEKGPVTKVYGAGDTFKIFLSNKGRLAYEYDSITSEQATALEEFLKLKNLAECSLPERYLLSSYELLAIGFSSTLRSKGPSNIQQTFGDAREYIEKRAQAVVASRYTLSSLGFSILGVVLLTLFRKYGPPDSSIFDDILLGGSGGITGAIISVMQRARALSYSKFLSTRHMIFEGFTRVLLGVIFGSLSILAIRADLLLGMSQDNSALLFITSVAAGFSERFIPDLLMKVTNHKTEE